MSSGNIYINRSAMTSSNSWDLMVDEFVRKNTSARRRHYSRSRSLSRTRSSSSTNSSYLRSRSRSRSPGSNKPRETGRRYSRKIAKKSPLNRKIRESNPQIKITHQTIECARAIGLDDEYLKKIEEQNRLREEIVRRKSQHRKEITTTSKTASLIDDGEAISTNKRPKVQGPAGEGGSGTTAGNKLRPYLAVVVTNLRGIGKVEHKIVQRATIIGPIKKIWRVGPDDCHVIFEKHEHAKQFMLQYHGKKVDKACIDVTLKKVFLNLNIVSGDTNKQLDN